TAASYACAMSSKCVRSPSRRYACSANPSRLSRLRSSCSSSSSPSGWLMAVAPRSGSGPTTARGRGGGRPRDDAAAAVMAPPIPRASCMPPRLADMPSTARCPHSRPPPCACAFRSIDERREPLQCRGHPPPAIRRVQDGLTMDALLLSRIQFAFVISFHVLFPAFTIGLAWWLSFVEWRWLRTHDAAWRRIYFFWMRIFAISFGMGVVSGIVMTFQFGANWPELSRVGGGILGPLLSYEVMTAFFLEASFLGVMLFGWGRVSEKLHFLATCMVAVGTLFSAFWILSANSWMH